MQALQQESIRKCAFTDCIEDALTLCRKCGKWFCLEHASDLDPTKFCQDCLLVADATLETHPLVDAEGTRHQGKLIRPVGLVFNQKSKLIHEMDEVELKEYITFYQGAVHDCERALDHARITLGNALYEAGDREIAKVNQRTGEVYFPSPKKVTQIRTKRAAAKATDENAIADFIAKHLTVEQLKKIMAKAKK
jgi:hypothetical protein